MRLVVPTVVLYGAGYPLGTATVQVMSPFLVIFLRFALSAAILWAIIVVRRTRLPSGKKFRQAAIAGLLTQGVQFLGLYWALANGVSSGLGSLIIALNPVVTASLMALFLGHRENYRGYVSLLLGASAVIVACTPKLLADHSIGGAIFVVIIAMLGLSVGGIYQGRRLSDVDPWVVTAIGVTASTPFAAIATFTSPIEITNLPRALTLVAIMTVLTSVGATTLYAACIRQSGARAASILFAVIPAAASIMAWVWLGEKLSALTIIALILGGAACIMQSKATDVQQHGHPGSADRSASTPRR